MSSRCQDEDQNTGSQRSDPNHWRTAAEDREGIEDGSRHAAVYSTVDVLTRCIHVTKTHSDSGLHSECVSVQWMNMSAL